MTGSRRPLLLGLFAVLLAAIAWAHWPALTGMKAMWDGTPMYSFGYIVPVISLFLVWSQREQLSAVALAPSPWLGAIIGAAALMLLVAGRVGGVLIAEQLAFVVALVAAVLLVLGRSALGAMWLALAYLLLMVPFWDAFTEPLHQPFQLLSASLGIGMLRMVGVPAHQEGVMLYLPNITLEVARACSGVNYLVAILALGVPLAYLYVSILWRRVVLIAAAVLIAALSNSLRVGLIGVLAYHDIGSPLHGPFHVLHGLFVSGIGYVVLLVGLRVLGSEAPAGAGSALARRAPASRDWGLLAVAPAVVMTALMLWVGGNPDRFLTPPLPLARSLDTLPERIGSWTADPLAPAPTAVWWASADAALHRRYVSAGASAAQVSIGYFAAQHQGHEAAGHLTAGLHRARLAGGGAAGSDAVHPVRLKSRSGDQVGFYWYDLDGDAIANPYAAKARIVWNSLAHGRTNGALVVVLAPAGDEAAIASQLDGLRTLATGVRDFLKQVIERPARFPRFGRTNLHEAEVLVGPWAGLDLQALPQACHRLDKIVSASVHGLARAPLAGPLGPLHRGTEPVFRTSHEAVPTGLVLADEESDRRHDVASPSRGPRHSAEVHRALPRERRHALSSRLEV